MLVESPAALVPHLSLLLLPTCSIALLRMPSQPYVKPAWSSVPVVFRLKRVTFALPKPRHFMLLSTFQCLFSHTNSLFSPASLLWQLGKCIALKAFPICSHFDIIRCRKGLLSFCSRTLEISSCFVHHDAYFIGCSFPAGRS